MKPKLSIKLICILILLPAFLTGYSLNGQSREEQNIQRIKVKMKDKLLNNPEDIINQHITAIGGEKALRSVKTLMYKGRNIILGKEERTTIRYYRQPDNLRQESPGRHGYVVSDGEKVFSVNGSAKQEVNFRWTNLLKHERIDGNFLDYKKRGINYKYLGLKALQTEPTVFYQLERSFQGGYHEELFFDVETGLLRMIKQKGYENMYRLLYEYKKIGPILYSHLNLRSFDNLTPPHIFVVDEVKINESYNDSFFN